jgi:hypothetical protein
MGESWMKEILRCIIDTITVFHQWFLKLNDSTNLNLNDKQLHFYIFGLACFVLFLFVHMVFKKLAKVSIMIISWFYTLTVAIVLAFAIEIGQRQSATGKMDFWDIVYGINGFLFFFAIFVFFLLIVFLFKKYVLKQNIRANISHKDQKF